ncbi:MAG: 23S rRNA (uracil(1939)-C(5))-methyltransferase RlmD [Acidobacteria bacterium]|nr:MAG: 23S rRNA (uracil(1939)-C(5))-methyltransferase RlmD [Acidobacteriota bacterium]
MKIAQADQTVDCPHRAPCGACSLLCQPYGEQLESKRRRLTDALGRSVRFTPRQILPTLPSPDIEGYRTRAKMAISTDRDRRSVLGYFQRRSREVVDAPDCGVLVPELLETTRALRRLLNSSISIPYALRYIDLRCGSDPELQHLTLVVRDDSLPRLPIEAIVKDCPHIAGIAVNLNPKGGSQVIKGRIEPVSGAREVYVDSAGLSLRVSPGSFFQVNLGLLPELHSRMSAFLGTGSLLVDLYAGVGTHGLALRKSFGRILCIEGVRSSVADARATIKAGQVDNVEVLANPIRRTLSRLHSEKPEAVVLNPSRIGAESQVLATIISSSAKRLAYLSCDPTTLARDLQMLIGGGFELVTVQAVDMMPQTRQIEALALLRR